MLIKSRTPFMVLNWCLLRLNCCLFDYSRPFGSWGLGGFSPPNNLLKFVDFVSEKGCKSQGRRNEDSNSYVFVEATRINQKCNVFLCHTSQKFQNFHGKTLISSDPLLPSIAHFPKMGRFPMI